jgi:methylglyoxal synthase
MRFAKMTLIIYLVVFVLAMAPLQSWAMVLPSSDLPQRAQDLSQIQTQLESKLVQERLSALGFTAQEVQTRMQDLTDEQIHALAQNLDGLQVGGDALILILAIVGAVVLVIFLISAVTGTAHDAGHAATGHH